MTGQKSKRPRLFIVVGVALTAILIWGVANLSRSGHSLRIGVILPLTGDSAVYGQAIKDGIELAAVQDSADGQTQIKLIYEDDQGVPRHAISAVRRLIDGEHAPMIIGGAQSATAEPIIPVIDQASVVLISPTATKPGLTGMSSFFFRLWPSDDYDGKVMAKAAYNDLSLRRVAILYVNVAYGVGITEVFTREFRALGGIIVSREGYKQGATDFRTLIMRIASLKPDAIYLPGYVAEIGNILRQARELDIRIRFIGVNSLYDPQLIKVAGQAAEGAVFTYPAYDVANADSSTQAFVSAFRERYRRDPNVFAAQGYDAYRVVAQAVTACDKRDGPSLRNALHALGRYTGPGGSFEFDKNGDVEKPLRLMIIHNGSFEELRGQLER